MKKIGADDICKITKNPFGSLLLLIIAVFSFQPVFSQGQDSVCFSSSVNPSCSDVADGSVRVFNPDQTAGNKKYEIFQNGVLLKSISSMSYIAFRDLPADTFTVKMHSYNTAADTWSLFCSNDIILVAPAALKVEGTSQNIMCKGINTGSIDLVISGGTGPYTVNWSNGKAQEDISNLAKGSYLAFVSDYRGCLADKSFTITEPATAVSMSMSSKNSDCTNKTGAVDITVSGGTTPYSFAWSNGVNTEDLSGLASGKYVVTVKDNNGCALKDSATLLTPPNSIVLSTSVTGVSCNGLNDGAAVLSITNGKSPFKILWSTGAVNPSVNGLKAGTYTVDVTDSNNCAGTATAIVTEPQALFVNRVATDVSCKGDANGTINTTVTGGTTPYTYKWSNAATTEDLTALAPGTYSEVVIDANGCRDSFTVSITEPATAIKSSVTATHLYCKGVNTGTVNLTVSGGTSPYTFEWSNGAKSEDLNNIPAGSYTVVVSDLNGCLTVSKIAVTEPAAALIINSTTTHIRCKGETNGAITVAAEGGVAPYDYFWTFNSSINTSLADLTSGIYAVSVTDKNNCKVTTDILVTEPAQIKAAFIYSIGCTHQDGVIDVSPTGGTAPYTFEWSDNQTIEDRTNLTPGMYTVTITDSRLCTYKDSVEIVADKNQCVNVPTGFTPNGDGVNDVWVLRNIESFPNCVVEIFDTGGNTVFSSTGYSIPWNGTIGGEVLPLGTYYYVINLNSGEKQLSGPVTIVR